MGPQGTYHKKITAVINSVQALPRQLQVVSNNLAYNDTELNYGCKNLYDTCLNYR